MANIELDWLKDLTEDADLPEGASVTEESSLIHIAYRLDCGTSGVDVTIDLQSSGNIRMIGTANYDFHASTEKIATFQESLKGTELAEPGFLVYSKDGVLRISWTKRRDLSQEDMEGSTKRLQSALEEFSRRVEKAVKEYETQCIDFDKKAVLNQSNVSSEESFLHEFDAGNIALETLDSEEGLAAATKEQERVLKEKLAEFAKFASTALQNDGTYVAFKYPDGADGEVTLDMENLAAVCQVHMDAGQNGNAVVCGDLEEAHEDWAVAWDENGVSVSQFCFPGEYDENPVITAALEELHKALSETITETQKRLGNPDTGMINAEIAKMLEARKALVEKAESVNAELKEKLEKEREELREEKSRLEKENADLKAKVAAKEEALANREAAISKREEAQDSILKEKEKERQQLVANIALLTNQLAGQKPKTIQVEGKGDPKEIAMLKKKADSAMAAKAKMETILNAKISDLNKTIAGLEEALTESKKKATEMDASMESRTSQIFAEKERDYKWKIEKLEKKVEEVGERLEFDDLFSYLSLGNGGFSDVTKNPGKNGDVIRFKDGGLTFTVVQGRDGNIIVDSIWDGNPSLETLNQANAGNQGAKFFKGEEGTVGRFFLPPTASVTNVEEAAHFLSGAFETEAPAKAKKKGIFGLF